jgi:hypothetical protein
VTLQLSSLEGRRSWGSEVSVDLRFVARWQEKLDQHPYSIKDDEAVRCVKMCKGNLSRWGKWSELRKLELWKEVWTKPREGHPNLEQKFWRAGGNKSSIKDYLQRSCGTVVMLDKVRQPEVSKPVAGPATRNGRVQAEEKEAECIWAGKGVCWQKQRVNLSNEVLGWHESWAEVSSSHLSQPPVIVW